MKRLFVLGLAVMALGVGAFAQESSGFVAKLNEKTTFDRVSEFVDVDYYQKRNLQYIFNEASKRFDRATAQGLGEEAALEKAINFNVANAKAILSDYQYRKYLQILNKINNETNPLFYASK